MEWGAEQIALAIAGALFLCGVVASVHPRLALSLTTRVVLSVAAGAYAAAATGYGWPASSAFGSLLWLVPLAVAVAVTRDMVDRRELRGVHVFPTRNGHLVARVTPPTAADAPSREVSDVSSQAQRAIDPATSSAELEELAYTHPEARCAVASHAATSANVLSWLARHGDDAVIEAIATRPQSERSERPPR